jgi:hypothetical protein
VRAGESLVAGAGDGVDRLGDLELVQELLEPLAVLGQVDGVRRGAEDRMPASSSGWASFSGVWPPNWTMTPGSSPFAFDSISSRTSSAVSGSK